MQVYTTIKSVDESLDILTKSLPLELTDWIKHRLSAILQNLLNLNYTDIRVDFIVDTNTIINTLLRYTEGKESILFKLIGSQTFRFHAPANVINEITDFILSTRKKVNKNKFVKGWKKIMSVLNIGTQISIDAFNFASVIIGNRDPKDVPFVAMYIDLGASNIITYDKDFDHPLLRPIKINNVGQVVSGVNRGLFSFFILNDLAPSTLEFCGQVILEVVKNLMGVVKQLLDLFSAIARNAIDDAINLLSNFFPQIKDWIESGAINSALLMIALITGGIVIFDKKARNNLLQLTNIVVNSLEPMITRFLDWIDNSIRFVSEWSKILLPNVVTILVTLFSNILRVISHAKIQASKS